MTLKSGLGGEGHTTSVTQTRKWPYGLVISFVHFQVILSAKSFATLIANMSFFGVQLSVGNKVRAPVEGPATLVAHIPAQLGVHTLHVIADVVSVLECLATSGADEGTLPCVRSEMNRQCLSGSEGLGTFHA